MSRFWFRFTAALAVTLVLALAGLVPWPMSRAAVRRSLKKDMAEVAREQTRDLTLIASRRAAEDAADFVASEMRTARLYKDKFALFDAALGRVDPRLEGMYCEFGVWKGTTINYIASNVPRPGALGLKRAHSKWKLCPRCSPM